MPETLPVIFRAERIAGRTEVVAVFPTEPATQRPSEFLIYAHIGQHGAGSLGWYQKTRAATPAEYAPLLRELRTIYNRAPRTTLRVVTRFHMAYHLHRRAAIK